MALHGHSHRAGIRFTFRRTGGTDSTAATTADHAAASATALARTLAGLRLVTAFTFLWAFFDKTFGWSYATQSGKGWIDGGSPTKGFLSHVAAGPMESTFHSWAGDTWADWLFMLGLLGIGIALATGVALRLAAVAGTALMALMWAAEWPPARHLSDGTLSASSNPLIDYHVVYAAVLITLAVAGAGRTWGLGTLWERLPFVGRNHWLK
ncbi:DoxX family membrane protein [Streptomyces melanogenes]|uniref:DoxX family membrane protein n=1 Tax=Streptomyces melanogenes TaxID=67326 RepID=UPI00167E7D7F|nr:DoxX family membrane protein [Streptomyces melanogenes]GGP94183.1 membrane protein [Streptomyces melanogenes]